MLSCDDVPTKCWCIVDLYYLVDGIQADRLEMKGRPGYIFYDEDEAIWNLFRLKERKPNHVYVLFESKAYARRNYADTNHMLLEEIHEQ